MCLKDCNILDGVKVTALSNHTFHHFLDQFSEQSTE